jgi:filamentous hemagglutinin
VGFSKAPNTTAGRLIDVDPASELRFTQRTAGGNGRADQWRQRFDQGNYGPPIEVVNTPDGLVTVDHTRAAVAVEKGVPTLKARVYQASDPLPQGMIDTKRFGDATTWGEAAAYRAANQRPPLPPTGTTTLPKLPKPRM